MKFIIIFCLFLSTYTYAQELKSEHYQKVDQVLWVVSDLEQVIENWVNLGFEQIIVLDKVQVSLNTAGRSVPARLAKANLGGAHITWIQPLDTESIFARFHSGYGDGAMSLIHKLNDRDAMDLEISRLAQLGVEVLEEITIFTKEGILNYTLMDTQEEGKYILGYTFGPANDNYFDKLRMDNLHDMKINQYAFAIRSYEPVSQFWHKLGQPEFQINHPELGDMHYYGKPTDHSLIQGWQRHGTVDYEWCIPVKLPIVYEDHIKLHGEGIHHLAFSVADMDKVLDDYTSKGYVNSMGGTWGDKGKPGSGRYEYIDLEDAGGVTVELLWNYKE